MRSGDWQRRLDIWTDTDALLTLLPELIALRGVRQSAEFHAEGDVYTHTRLAVNAVDPATDERVFWAVLLHDIGKPATTECVNGCWRSHGHVQKSAEMVPPALKRLALGRLIEDVVWLVKHHHFVFDWGAPALVQLTPRQKRFCALPLFPLLVAVCRADAVASIGSSRKGEMLESILRQLADKNRESHA